MKKYKNIIYVTPVQIKNMGNFRNYLIENTEYLITYHFFHAYSNSRSYMEIYNNGEEILKYEFPLLGIKNNILRTILYKVILDYILIKYVKKNSYVIVEKPFFLIFSSFYSFIKKLNYIYWIGDYYPDNKGFMKLYNWLSEFYNRNLGIVWYVSPPIKQIYNKKENKNLLEKRTRKLVTLGTTQKTKLKRIRSNKIIKLGYIGIIDRRKGLELVFSYLQKYDNATFEVIGDGYDLDYYKNLVTELKIQKKVKFYGYVDDVDSVICKWDIGVALYVTEIESNIKYCEPTKIKNYLEYEIPVITTRSTYFYYELQRKFAGIAINYSVYELKNAINIIIANKTKYKNGTRQIIKDYEYNKYYDSRLVFMSKDEYN